MPPRLRWQYETCCVSASVADLEPMIAQAREITWSTFRLYVDRPTLAAVFPQYDWRRGPAVGLRMQKDWAVAYYRSTYQGRPCVYVVHSSIEYIFTEGGAQ